MIVLYFLICLAATVLGAISGIGGGVIIKPVMDAISGMPVATISFLSGCTVLAMSVVSVLRGTKGEERIEPRRGTLLAAGSALGGLVGKAIFDLAKARLSADSVLGAIQSAVMILLTLGVLLYVLYKQRIPTRNIQNGITCLAIGLLLGMMSAFLGIGGGPINLAVLYYCFSMSTKTAALHSLYIILFGQITSLASTVLSGSIPSFQPVILAAMILGGVVGGFAGRAINRKLSAARVDLLFRGMLILITLISCYNLYRNLVM